MLRSRQSYHTAAVRTTGQIEPTSRAVNKARLSQLGSVFKQAGAEVAAGQRGGRSSAFVFCNI